MGVGPLIKGNEKEEEEEVELKWLRDELKCAGNATWEKKWVHREGMVVVLAYRPP
jgi:hypothetical protein